jgi:hypothetical protein
MENYLNSPINKSPKDSKYWSKSIETVKVAKSYITASFALFDKVKDSYTKPNNKNKISQLKFYEKKHQNYQIKSLVTDVDNSNHRRVKEVLLDSKTLSFLPPIVKKEKNNNLTKKNNFKKIKLTNDKIVKINQIKFNNPGKYENFIRRHDVGNIFYNRVEIEK